MTECRDRANGRPRRLKMSTILLNRQIKCTEQMFRHLYLFTKIPNIRSRYFGNKLRAGPGTHLHKMPVTRYQNCLSVVLLLLNDSMSLRSHELNVRSTNTHTRAHTRTSTNTLEPTSTNAHKHTRARTDTHTGSIRRTKIKSLKLALLQSG